MFLNHPSVLSDDLWNWNRKISFRTYRCVLSVADWCTCACLYVCLFPDSSRLTPEGLQHIGTLKNLKILILHRLSANVTSGQGQEDPWKWIRGLVNTLRLLEISGELQPYNYTHTVDTSTAWTELTVGIQTTQYWPSRNACQGRGTVGRFERAKLHLAPSESQIRTKH